MVSVSFTKGVQTMSVSLTTAQELLGLFELDDAGKVLYCRMDSAGEPSGTSQDIVGHNFYNEVAHFENVDEFRRCVTEFTRSAGCRQLRFRLPLWKLHSPRQSAPGTHQ